MTDKVDVLKAAELAQKVVAIFTDIDGETRSRAISAALALMGESNLPIPNAGDSDSEVETDLASFFERNDCHKPADFVHLCAAYHYRNNGNANFSVSNLRAIADEAGVVVPDRVDMTLSQATKGGKKLFQNIGKGTFKPTAAAALYFRERWNVKPARRRVNKSEES